MPSPFDSAILEDHETSLEELSPALRALYDEQQAINDLQRTIDSLLTQREEMTHRMDDQGFDGDFDPRAPLRGKTENARFAMEGRQKKYRQMEEALTGADKGLYAKLDEDACEWAREEAADRKVRYYENGCRE